MERRTVCQLLLLNRWNCSNNSSSKKSENIAEQCVLLSLLCSLKRFFIMFLANRRECPNHIGTRETEIVGILKKYDLTHSLSLSPSLSLSFSLSLSLTRYLSLSFCQSIHQSMDLCSRRRCQCKLVCAQVSNQFGFVLRFHI